MATMKEMVQLYRDSFGEDNLIIVTDNVKIFKNSQGRKLIFDDDREIVHSLEVNTDGINFGEQHLFHFESFSYDQIQFLSNFGNADELKMMLDMLESTNAIDETKRADLIKYFKDQFAFSYGYGDKPYTKDTEKYGSNKEEIPTDKEGDVLTPGNTLSLNKIKH